MTGIWVVLVTLVAAGLVGLLWRGRQGRVRPAPDSPDAMDALDALDALGGSGLPEPVLGRVDRSVPVTLLQLTTPVCARCPQARALLRDVAAATPGVRHAELDLAEHPELPGRLGVRSTPTTLAITAAGHELFRVVGVPRRDDLLDALTPHL